LVGVRRDDEFDIGLFEVPKRAGEEREFVWVGYGARGLPPPNLPMRPKEVPFSGQSRGRGRKRSWKLACVLHAEIEDDLQAGVG
jgi:hypothetical protein